ncbi:hypothetical protein IV203_020683 [Nitzschia inconspicua]|uniref:Uncharacterized protein n=1 Tax=Nitzschia inconspicua TaxID=303405 RepID=A0A9K3KFE7_9STRA|nr:hypothetical protein IV203_020683 [Nitzschia inconspicua]
MLCLGVNCEPKIDRTSPLWICCQDRGCTANKRLDVLKEEEDGDLKTQQQQPQSHISKLLLRFAISAVLDWTPHLASMGWCIFLASVCFCIGFAKMNGNIT